MSNLNESLEVVRPHISYTESPLTSGSLAHSVAKFKNDIRSNEASVTEELSIAPQNLAEARFKIFPRHSQENITLHPRTIADAAERALLVREDYTSGRLSEEVERLGVNTNWLDQYHQQPVSVGIAEQLMPLPTMLAKLGRHGNPEALIDALVRVDAIADSIERSTGTKVMSGMLYSEMQMVRRDSITSGPYFLIPDFNKEAAERAKPTNFDRIRLLSKGQLEKADGIPFRSLQLTQEQLNRAGQRLQHEANWAIQRSSKEGERSEKLEKYINQIEKNRGNNNQNGELSDSRQLYTRQRAGLRLYEREKLTRDCCVTLNKIWLQAYENTASKCVNGSSIIRYDAFVSEINRLFVKLFSTPIQTERNEANFREHQTTSTQIVDNLATSGISDWKKFLSAFYDSGILKRGEPIFRRVDDSGKMRMMVIDNFDKLTFRDTSNGTIHNIQSLVDESKISLNESNFPRLVPVAVLRYWAMLVVGNGIVLEDGMPYQKINRVFRAAQDSNITLRPRGLLAYPYTDLNHFTPVDSSDPYNGLREEFTAIDYLRLASRKAMCDPNT
jgi:hypothetical protein